MTLSNTSWRIDPLALAAALVVALAVALFPAPAPARETGGGPLIDAAELGHEEALAKAKAEGKFIMAYFWTTWCPNCAWFNESVLGDAKVAETLARDFVFLPLDADVERDLSRRYVVRVVPTTVFLDPDGEPATILPGVAPPDVFVSILDYLSSRAYLDMEFDAYVDLGPAAPKPPVREPALASLAPGAIVAPVPAGATGAAGSPVGGPAERIRPSGPTLASTAGSLALRALSPGPLSVAVSAVKALSERGRLIRESGGRN
jgi:thiol-disulfide isomerase/thioredoxin